MWILSFLCWRRPCKTIKFTTVLDSSCRVNNWGVVPSQPVSMALRPCWDATSWFCTWKSFGQAGCISLFSCICAFGMISFPVAWEEVTLQWATIHNTSMNAQALDVHLDVHIFRQQTAQRLSSEGNPSVCAYQECSAWDDAACMSVTGDGSTCLSTAVALCSTKAWSFRLSCLQWFSEAAGVQISWSHLSKPTWCWCLCALCSSGDLCLESWGGIESGTACHGKRFCAVWCLEHWYCQSSPCPALATFFFGMAVEMLISTQEACRAWEYHLQSRGL